MPKKLFLLSLLWVAVACDEHLPSRNDPSDLLSARLETTWSLTSLENQLYVRLILTNTYDEVIEGTVNIEGAITISFSRDPSYTRTFDLTSALVDNAPTFDDVKGFMQIPPGESMSFLLTFDWTDDRGRDVRGVMIYEDDPDCGLRRVAARESFLIRGEAKLFTRIAAATAHPVLFELCHVSVWINPKFCVPVTGPTSACLQ